MNELNFAKSLHIKNLKKTTKYMLNENKNKIQLLSTIRLIISCSEAVLEDEIYKKQVH